MSTPRSRLRALDVARALAIIGMIAVHVGPLEGSGPSGALLRLGYGRASLLFVLLAGVGMGLMLRSGRAGRTVSMPAVLAWRTFVLVLLGLSLQHLDHGVNVILTMYGALFLVAAPLDRLGNRSLLGLTAALGLLGPVVLIAAGQVPDGTMHDPALGDPPGQIVSDLVLTGTYPLLVWAAPFVLGLCLARLDLRSARLQRWFIGLGLAMAVVGYGVSTALEAAGVSTDALESPWAALATSGAHSQMPLWLIEGLGVCLVLLGVLLWVERSWGSRPLRALDPLVAFGQLALTLYVGHLLVIAALIRPFAPPEDALGGLLWSAGLVLAGLVFASAWRHWFARGPLEYLLQLPRLLFTPPTGPSTQSSADRPA